MTATEQDKKQTGLPFDQHQRYKIVADAVERLRGDSEPLEVLDVGGGEGVILNFLSEDRVTILDQTEVEGVPGFVVGDAMALPFEDGSFDYVVSVDVYEHIETEAREKFLTELRRVARRGVLLAAPFDSAEVRGAEKLANEFHRTIHLQENVWLGEHEQNGLPDLDWARAYFERREDAVFVLPNGYLPHWLAMISLFFYEVRLEGDSRLLLDHINSFYNEFMYEHDNAEPSYRHLVVALKEAPDGDGVDLGRLASPSDHPAPAMGSALFAAFSAALAPVAQLKGTDARLAQKDELLAQKDLQLNHKNNLLAQRELQLRDLLERFAQQAATANAVPGLQKQVAALREDRDLYKQRLDEMKEQAAALKTRRDELKQQLGGSQKPAEPGEEGRLRGRLGEAQKQIVALKEDRNQLKQRLDDMRGQASPSQEERDQLKEQLAEMKKQAVVLKAERTQLKEQLDAIKGSTAWKIIHKQRTLRIALRDRLRPGSRDG